MTGRRTLVLPPVRALLERRWLSAVIREAEELTAQAEGGLALQASRWGGAEIRPTRLFLWVGPTRDGREWVLSTGFAPRLSKRPRRWRHLQFGSCHLSFLGNPALTLTLFATNSLRCLIDRNGRRTKGG
jgi:hypothetical protein